MNTIEMEGSSSFSSHGRGAGNNGGANDEFGYTQQTDQANQPTSSQRQGNRKNGSNFPSHSTGFDYAPMKEGESPPIQSSQVVGQQRTNQQQPFVDAGANYQPPTSANFDGTTNANDDFPYEQSQCQSPPPPLPQQQQPQPKHESASPPEELPQSDSKPELVGVETVRGEEDEDGTADGSYYSSHPNHHQSSSLQSPAPVRFVIACCPQTTAQGIQFGLSLLCVLIVVGAAVSLWSIQKYRFVITIIWVWLILLLVGFVYFVHYQYDQQQQKYGAVLGAHNRAPIFPNHPILQAAADMIANELEWFQEDWRAHVLMIEYDPEYQDESQMNDDMDECPGGALDRSSSPMATTTTATSNNNSPKKKGWVFGRRGGSSSEEKGRPLREDSLDKNGRKQQQRQPKSRLFRTFAMPLLPILRRGAAGSKNRDTEPNGNPKMEKKTRKKERRGSKKKNPSKGGGDGLV